MPGLHVRVTDFPETDQPGVLEPAAALRRLHAWALTLPPPVLDRAIDRERAKLVADYLEDTPERVLETPKDAMLAVTRTREDRPVDQFIEAARQLARSHGLSEEEFLERVPSALAASIRKDGAKAGLTSGDVRRMVTAAGDTDTAFILYAVDPSDEADRRFCAALEAASALAYDARRPSALRHDDD
jgi:hypothetical protein